MILLLEIKGVLIALRLINPDNLCYIHATLMAFFWGFVHLRCCNWADLGGAAKLLIALCCRDSLWVDVRELEPWAEWISSWDDGQQHDGSEFLKAFLAYVCPPALTGSWIRKIQTEGTIQVQDRGTAFMPPSLVTSDPAQKKVSLQSMINEWQDYLGMITAFEHDSPLICFQLDRFDTNALGETTKAAWHLDLGPVTIQISPEQDSLSTMSFEYTPIAGILHRGLDKQGHLQCAGLHQGQWLIFNDGVEASLLAEGAAPKATDWVCIWLIRSSRLRSVKPQHYARGHDARVHQLMDYVSQHRWQELEANENLTKYFSLHCGACAQLFLDAGSLAKHVFRRHSPCRKTLLNTMEWVGIDHKAVETPCLFCKAIPVFGEQSKQLPYHTCPTVMNMAIAKDYFLNELSKRGSIYGTARGSAALFNAAAEPPRSRRRASSLGDWLADLSE